MTQQNQLTAEGNIAAGTGSQTGISRWGDYSQMSIDPSDGCTFWYTGEYYLTTGCELADQDRCLHVPRLLLTEVHQPPPSARGGGGSNWHRMELSNGALVHHSTHRDEPADLTITLIHPQFIEMLSGTEKRRRRV